MHGSKQLVPNIFIVVAQSHEKTAYLKGIIPIPTSQPNSSAPLPIVVSVAGGMKRDTHFTGSILRPFSCVVINLA